MHWAARQAAVSISLMWVSQLEASSLLSQRSMLCDWSLQASTSLMRLSCRILNLREEQNIVENISNITATRAMHKNILISKFSTKTCVHLQQEVWPHRCCSSSCCKPAFTGNPKLWLTAKTPLFGHKQPLYFQNKLLHEVLQQCSLFLLSPELCACSATGTFHM